MKFDAMGLLFPRRCPVCQDVVEDRGERCCRICRRRLPHVKEPFCLKCGKPLLEEEKEYCRDCAGKKHFYRQGRAAFVYDETMKRSIAGFKYNGRKEYAAFYAEEILRKCARQILTWEAQALVPIPLHASRRRKRGYNQAQLLARELSRRSGIPVDAKLLRRKKKTRAQKELTDTERHTNLKNAFSLGKSENPYQRVILIDDIYTTGSTIDEASRVLMEHGTQSVFFLCICVGNGA